MYVCMFVDRLSHQSASSSIDDSDDDMGRRQPMERNIYSEGGDSSSDESSNDSFTASEFEADEPKVCSPSCQLLLVNNMHWEVNIDIKRLMYWVELCE